MGHLAAEGLAARSVMTGDVMTDVCLMVADRVGDAPRGPARRRAATATCCRRSTGPRTPTTPSDCGPSSRGSGRSPSRWSSLAHPRLVQRARHHGIDLDEGSLHTIEPLDYPAMVAAVRNANHVVTDSGGLQKEAFLLRTPCTTVRTETEWTETVDLGWNVLALDPARPAGARRPPGASGDRRDPVRRRPRRPRGRHGPRDHPSVSGLRTAVPQPVRRMLRPGVRAARRTVRAAKALPRTPRAGPHAAREGAGPRRHPRRPPSSAAARRMAPAHPRRSSRPPGATGRPGARARSTPGPARARWRRRSRCTRQVRRRCGRRTRDSCSTVQRLALELRQGTVPERPVGPCPRPPGGGRPRARP